MYKAILFDLDNTLLGNSMEEVFGPAFFQTFADYIAPLVPPEKAMQALMAGLEAMDACEGNGPTTADAFWAAFYPLAGCQPKELEPLTDQYYAEEFDKLRYLTRTLPDALPVVELAFNCAPKVAIATGALLPRTAAEQRLDWAGVPVTRFNYAFVASWDVMHASKPYPGYYQEILAYLGQSAGECLMVGDNWKEDILPTAGIGMSSYWITESREPPAAHGLPLVGQGKLADLMTWLKNEI